MSKDQETEDDQNDDVDDNDKVPQECAKCKHPIRHKAPEAICNDCGVHYHLVCTGLLRTQREENRDRRRVELLFWSRGDRSRPRAFTNS